MKRIFTWILVFLVSLVLMGTAGGYFGYLYYVKKPLEPNEIPNAVFDTADATTLSQIARRLEQERYIRSARAFQIVARYQKKDTAIKAGEYELSPSMTPQEILDKMVRGDMVHRRTTITEGMTLKDIAQAFDASGVVNKKNLETAMSNKALLEGYGIESDSFEGYLFPETYHFPRNTEPHVVIKAMVRELQKRWAPEWNERLESLSMTRHQLLTLASIIEKESGNFDEQPIISSVFHNRLRIRMRLQADPTVIYGIPDFNGNITKSDLKTYSPYNTYIIDGLPPGPIANPGLSAIKAALYPAETNFLYFVGSGDGRHIFSADLRQHNNAVNTYQRQRKTDNKG